MLSVVCCSTASQGQEADVEDVTHAICMRAYATVKPRQARCQNSILPCLHACGRCKIGLNCKAQTPIAQGPPPQHEHPEKASTKAESGTLLLMHHNSANHSDMSRTQTAPSGSLGCNTCIHATAHPYATLLNAHTAPLWIIRLLQLLWGLEGVGDGGLDGDLRPCAGVPELQLCAVQVIATVACSSTTCSNNPLGLGQSMTVIATV